MAGSTVPSGWKEHTSNRGHASVFFFFFIFEPFWVAVALWSDVEACRPQQMAGPHERRSVRVRPVGESEALIHTLVTDRISWFVLVWKTRRQRERLRFHVAVELALSTGPARPVRLQWRWLLNIFENGFSVNPQLAVWLCFIKTFQFLRKGPKPIPCILEIYFLEQKTGGTENGFVSISKSRWHFHRGRQRLQLALSQTFLSTEVDWVRNKFWCLIFCTTQPCTCSIGAADLGYMGTSW